MRKEIDFGNAPEGATHYFTTKSHNPVTEFYREAPDGFEFYDTGHCKWEESCKGYDWCIASLLEMPKTHWTPQANTLPLRDLSDEQAAQLFNAWRCGAKIEVMASGRFGETSPMWRGGEIYRIKPKSPKQEFVDSIIEHYKGSTFLDGSVIDMLESAYDAGLFK